MARARSARPNNNQPEVAIRGELLDRARELGLDAAKLLEEALEQAIRNVEREAWQRDNEAAIDHYNEWVAEHGGFSDAWRRW